MEFPNMKEKMDYLLCTTVVRICRYLGSNKSIILGMNEI